VTVVTAAGPSFAPAPDWLIADIDGALAQMTIQHALVCLKQRRSDLAKAAIDSLDKVVHVGATAASTLGLIALSVGAPNSALVWLDRALALEPLQPNALSSRALALAQLGRAFEADLAFGQAFRAGCDDPAAHYNHGNILSALGRRDDAIEAYDRALRLRPAYPEALRAGGGILKETGRFEQALAFWGEALRLRPTYLDAILDRSNLLYDLGRVDEALAALDAGLAHLPTSTQLLNNRGAILLQTGRPDDALAVLDLALLIDGSFAPAHLHKGEALVRQGRFDQALASFDRAIALRPDYIEAICAKGVALKLLGRFDAARGAFEEALRLDPQCVYARTNRGELKLLLGDFESGWIDYDARFQTRGHAKPVLGTSVPEWRGQRAPGRVAVFADQAAGDIIHFARYLPVLRGLGAEVTLICRPRMQRLLRVPSAGMRVVDAMPAGETFDYQIPLSSMPYACNTIEATIPARPYLAAEDELVQIWRDRIGSAGFKVGVCWRGSQDRRSDPKRSVPLAALAPLAALPGVRLISLQMADHAGPDADHIKALGIETIADDLDSGSDGFVETAALMANLDLIVSCDTSIAHLAGALGRPTFVLLQTVPEWRFMIGREDSPWYPSMRLFRQDRLDDWDGPVRRLSVEIGQRAAAAA
jgi:tetratricopeptide (TPR) repeat protein